jgi:hypothetical protein
MGGAGDFSLFCSFQADSEAHQVSYTMDTVGCFSRDKAAGAMKLTTHLHVMLRLRMMK